MIEPRDSYYRGLKDKLFALQRVKADAVSLVEGSSPGYAMAKYCGHHRGRRAGHAFTGGNSGTWESQLSPCREYGQGEPFREG